MPPTLYSGLLLLSVHRREPSAAACDARYDLAQDKPRRLSSHRMRSAVLTARMGDEHCCLRVRT